MCCPGVPQPAAHLSDRHILETRPAFKFPEISPDDAFSVEAQESQSFSEFCCPGITYTKAASPGDQARAKASCVKKKVEFCTQASECRSGDRQCYAELMTEIFWDLN